MSKLNRYKIALIIAVVIIVLLILVGGFFLLLRPLLQNYIFGREQQAQQELIDYILNSIEGQGQISITSGNRSYTLVPAR